MFDHLIGNQTVKDAIGRFIAARRIPNSLLFAGPEGVGKKQFALELARSIVCRQPHNGDACGQCAACQRAASFVFPGTGAKGEEYDRVFFSEHPDVGMVVPFNRTLRVGSIRALEAEANFRPYEAPARIFIIDDAQKMNDASSNALLKTLEEPPPTSHIFLIASKPDSLLPTIRSRVQTLRFGPPAAAEIEHLLLKTHKYAQDDARQIAASSNGNVSRAVSVDIDEFRVQHSAAVEILRSAVVQKDVPGILKFTEKFGGRPPHEFESFLDILQAIIRDVWSESLGAPGRRAPEIKGIAAAADPASLMLWFQEIDDIRSALAVNINKKIALDSLFVQMAA
jgi:DNA polymerase-3 subunit delta'